MGLRLRIILTLLAVIIPITITFTIYRFGTEIRNHTERRVERFARRPPPRILRKCERNPERFTAQKNSIEVWAYDSSLKSKNPKAPPFPVFFRDVGEETISKSKWFNKDFIGQSAKRYSDEGDCAILLFQWKGHRRSGGVVRSVVIQSILMVVVLTLLGLAISVPLVGRIRRLKRAVSDLEHVGFDKSVYKKDDELDDLARSFGDVLERLSRRDDDLKKYVANTTHDLATPITVLQHRLRRLGDLELSLEAKTLVRQTLEESHYVASLIANMSAAARLDNELVKTRVNFNSLVERIVQRHVPIAKTKRISLDFALPVDALFVACDETLTEQAVSNFVQNAIQYNIEGGNIAVVLEEEGGSFSIKILDDGPGVNPDILSRLTERSIRSDSARNRNPGGQGFGLSIASNVAQLHEWSLSFRNSEPGFEVQLKGKASG